MKTYCKTKPNVFFIDQPLLFNDIVREKYTGRFGYIFSRKFRADCRVIGHNCILFDVDCMHLRPAFVS